MHRVAHWVLIALGIALALTLVGTQWQRMARGRNDFAALYAGAKLAGTAGLYSRSANNEVIAAATGVTMQTVTYTRPPFYAVVLKPLAALPYLTAYFIFVVACLAGVLWFVVRFSAWSPPLPLFAALSIPIPALFVQGQDTPLLLLALGSFMLLARSKRDFAAGVVLSLCAIKFHLFLLVPLLIVVKQRWSILLGGVFGTVCLFGLGVWIAGVESTRAYLAVLRDPGIHFSPEMMPNLHGLARTLNTVASVEILLYLAVFGTFLWLATSTGNFEFLLGLSLVGSLLISYHSGIGDSILLLPAFVLVTMSCSDVPLRLAISTALTPLAYFVGAPVSVTVPLLLLVVMALAIPAARHVCVTSGTESRDLI